MKMKLTPKAKTKLSTRQAIKIAAYSTAGAGILIAAIWFFLGNFGTSQNASALPIPDAKSDYALQFNGLNGDVVIGNRALPIDSQLTIVALVRWDTIPAHGNKWANIISCNSTTSSDLGRFWIQHNSNNSKFEFALQTSSGRSMVFSNTSPVANRWYHLACTYDGNKIRIFVNGVEENSVSKSGLIRAHQNDFQTVIGAWSNSNNNYRRFKGSINNVAIFNRALTPAAINQLKCSNFTSFPIPPVAAWSVNENDGTELIDISGNNFNGTYRNASPVLMGKVDCSTLPVEMMAFDAIQEDNAVVLHWTTASEKNNDRFAIERSYDGLNYQTIGNEDGNGNSNVRIDYTFTDYPGEFKTVYYRIQQIDFDGNFEYFGPVSIGNEEGERTFTVYPNPLPYSQEVKIEGLLPTDKVEFVDINGGIHYESRSLEPGNYFVRVNGNSISRLMVIK